MDPVKRVSGKALPLGYSDVDTDQIVPSDALKRIERTGFGQFLFSGWREDPQTVITVELTERVVSGPNVYETFEMDDFTRQRLMEGLDDISLTLTHEEDLEAFENSRPSYLPKVL